MTEVEKPLGSNTQTVLRVLTMDLLLQSFQRCAEESAKPPCGSGARPHRINTHAYERGGWTICASCLGPVFVPREAQ